MNPSTVLCTHGCANSCLTKPQTLNPVNRSMKVKKARAHSESFYLTSAKTSSKIVQKQARRSRIRMSLVQRKKSAGRWPSARCSVTSSSSGSSASWASCRSRFYIVASSSCWRRKGEGDPGGTRRRISSASARLCVPAAVSLTRIRAADLWINTSNV